MIFGNVKAFKFGLYVSKKKKNSKKKIKLVIIIILNFKFVNKLLLSLAVTAKTP